MTTIVEQPFVPEQTFPNVTGRASEETTEVNAYAEARPEVVPLDSGKSQATHIGQTRRHHQPELFVGSRSLYAESAAEPLDSGEGSSDVSMMDVVEDPAEKDDAFTAEDEARERQSQRGLHQEGARNYDIARATQALRLPKDVLQLYMKVYPVVRQWWVVGVKNITYIEKINSNIEKLNKAKKRPANQHKFPVTWLMGEIENLTTALRDHNQYQGHERAEKTKDLVIAVKTAMEKLDNMGIPFKSLTPSPIMKQIGEILLEGETLAKGLAALAIAHFRSPVPCQGLVLKRMAADLDHYAEALEKNDTVRARKIFDTCNSHNQELDELQKLYGLIDEKSSYAAPIGSLEKFLYTNSFTKEQRLKAIDQFKRQHIPPYLLEPSTQGADSPHMLLAGAPAPAFPCQTSSVSAPIPVILHPAAVHKPSRGFARSSAPELASDTGPSQSIDSSSAVGSDTVEYHSAGFELPTCRDGCTYLGRIIGIRKSGFGFRVILDCGTPRKPHYKIFPASTFGKGVIAGLHQQYQLKGPSVPVKSRQSQHIKTVRHSVTVDGAELQRASPAYFFVEYKATEENPYRSHPLTEWLTASELSTICGRKLVKSHIAPKCSAKWHANDEFFQNMRAQMLHPDTKRALTRADRLESPWLFPDDDIATTDDEQTDPSSDDEENAADMSVDEDRYD